MIITTKDANGENVRLNVRQVHRSLEAALPDVLVRLAADFWTGAQRTMTLADWNAIVERCIAELSARVRELESAQNGDATPREALKNAREPTSGGIWVQRVKRDEQGRIAEVIGSRT